VDHVHQLPRDQILGTCSRFRIEYFDEDPVGTKGRTTPLAYFEGCNTQNHATIVLRGNKNKGVLKRLKKVMRLALHIAYNSILEVSLLNDQWCSFPEICNKEFEKIQKENEKVGFLSSSPLIRHQPGRKRASRSRRHVDTKKSEKKNSLRKRRHSTGIDTKSGGDDMDGKADSSGSDNAPYCHHSLGPDVNIIACGWDPFIDNTDNEWMCQSILLTHCRLVKCNQCFAPKTKLIDFYTSYLDMPLDKYLVQLLDLLPCPSEKCREPSLDHHLAYNHHDGRVTITVTHLNKKQPIHKFPSPDNEEIVM